MFGFARLVQVHDYDNLIFLYYSVFKKNSNTQVLVASALNTCVSVARSPGNAIASMSASPAFGASINMENQEVAKKTSKSVDRSPIPCYLIFCAQGLSCQLSATKCENRNFRLKFGSGAITIYHLL